MTYLLDTHVLLWMVFEPEKLSARAVELVLHPRATLKVSTASVWEALLKAAKGKLLFLESEVVPAEFLERAMRQLEIQPLPVELEHVVRASTLPRLHSDPFDRLIVAQAIVEGLVLITADDAVQAYPVRTAW